MRVISYSFKTIAQNGKKAVTFITHVVYGMTERSISLSHILQYVCLSQAFNHGLHVNMVKPVKSQEKVSEVILNSYLDGPV